MYTTTSFNICASCLNYICFSFIESQFYEAMPSEGDKADKPRVAPPKKGGRRRNNPSNKTRAAITQIRAESSKKSVPASKQKKVAHTSTGTTPNSSSAATPSPSTSSTSTPLPPQSGSSPFSIPSPVPHKPGRSFCWMHFHVDQLNGKLVRKCNYCPVAYTHAGGTGNMALHLKMSHPDKIKTSLSQMTLGGGTGSGGGNGDLSLRAPLVFFFS